MKNRETHFMVDIETTGTVRNKDKILQVAVVEITANEEGFWVPQREYESLLHYAGNPENEFAKKYMAPLYARCNDENPEINEEFVGRELRKFLRESKTISHEQQFHRIPLTFMGWNASNFDIPFLCDAGMLIPSYYAMGPEGKEQLQGDAHYRVYEQTGSVQLISDMTGLDRKTIETLAMDLNPTGLELPKGKEHDALYDCYKQIIMQNGLIKIGRMGIKR